MNYKVPKDQSHYIPGSNPLGNPNIPVKKGKKLSSSQEKMQRQLMQSQEKIMSLYSRRLTKKDREILQDFFVKQYKVGSAIFNSLPSLLKELVLKLNIEGASVMMQYTKNPFKKLYLSFSRWSLNSLLKNLSSQKRSLKTKVSTKKKDGSTKKLLKKHQKN